MTATTTNKKYICEYFFELRPPCELAMPGWLGCPKHTSPTPLPILKLKGTSHPVQLLRLTLTWTVRKRLEHDIFKLHVKYLKKLVSLIGNMDETNNQTTSAESNEILLETGDGPLHQSPSSPDWSGVDILRSNKEAVKPTYIRNICLYALKDLRHQVWVETIF